MIEAPTNSNLKTEVRVVNKARNTGFVDAEARIYASYSLEPRSRDLRLTKPAILVRAVEVGTGEPALFLHGFSLCSAHWTPLFARLPSLRRIAIDMPGHAASDGVDYRGVNLRSWYTAMLTSTLDELGLESAHIIGHSQGAMFGMWLALDAPARVRSLVTIGTPAVALGARLDGLRMLARPGIGSFMLSMPKSAPMYRRILVDTIGLHAVDAAPDGLVRVTYLATRNGGFGKTVSTYLREMFRGIDAIPPRYVLRGEELAQISRPVLMVWGRDDRHQPFAVAQEMVRNVHAVRFVVVSGGHEPWLDDLHACADSVSAFLSK